MRQALPENSARAEKSSRRNRGQCWTVLGRLRQSNAVNQPSLGKNFLAVEQVAVLRVSSEINLTWAMVSAISLT